MIDSNNAPVMPSSPKEKFIVDTVRDWIARDSISDEGQLTVFVNEHFGEEGQVVINKYDAFFQASLRAMDIYKKRFSQM